MSTGELERRASVHAALGEPLRLAIVDELMVSDRSPTELARRFDVPSNLLAHHLDVLVRAGVVERIASTGDARRRYVRLHHRAFDGLVGRARRRPDRMTFVCSHNSARSQLAAAIWSSRTGEEATSAGTNPAAEVHPAAVAAAHRIGLDLSDAVPRPFVGADGTSQLVTVCDQAHEALALSATAWHWSISDPVAVGTDDAFDRAVRDLCERIDTINDAGRRDHD